jgi:hypothetical protein
VVNDCTAPAHVHRQNRTWLVRSEAAQALSSAWLAVCNLRAKKFFVALNE